MNFHLSPELKELRARVRAFVDEKIIPHEAELVSDAKRTRLKALLPGVTDEAKLWSSKAHDRSEALLALERELAVRLRSGRIKIDDKVIDHLVQTAKDTLAVTNPRFELGDEP